jgi:hypothetical protein
MQRLADPKKSQDDVMNLIALLLATDPASTPVIKEILNVVKVRADRAITGRVLERFGAVRCTNELALSFVSESLNSADVDLRQGAVSSLLPQSGAVLRRFQPRLMQIAADPDEDGRIRAVAEEVLKSVR